MKKKSYYALISYLQYSDDTQAFYSMQERGDYNTMLEEASNYDYGDAPKLTETYKNPEQNFCDDLICENEYYAIIYNGSVGGTYAIFRKISIEQILENISRYGMPMDATEDVRSIVEKGIEYWRNPTDDEVSFGYGYIHWLTVKKEDVTKSDGKLKKWFIGNDGLRYYRA